MDITRLKTSSSQNIEVLMNTTKAINEVEGKEQDTRILVPPVDEKCHHQLQKPQRKHTTPSEAMFQIKCINKCNPSAPLSLRNMAPLSSKRSITKYNLEEIVPKQAGGSDTIDDAKAEDQGRNQEGKAKGVPHLTKWEIMFDRLVEFKEKHGHCLVPNRYKADNKLGSWVSTQRRQYKAMETGRFNATTLPDDRVQRLESIGFIWSTSDPRRVEWDVRFSQLDAFREEHGHTMVPMGYEANLSLANWVSVQRQEYKNLQQRKPSKITKARIGLLESVGFTWKAPRGARRKQDTDPGIRNPLHLLTDAQERSSSSVRPSLSSASEAAKHHRQILYVAPKLEGVEYNRVENSHLLLTDPIYLSQQTQALPNVANITMPTNSLTGGVSSLYPYVAHSTVAVAQLPEFPNNREAVLQAACLLSSPTSGQLLPSYYYSGATSTALVMAQHQRALIDRSLCQQTSSSRLASFTQSALALEESRRRMHLFMTQIEYNEQTHF